MAEHLTKTNPFLPSSSLSYDSLRGRWNPESSCRVSVGVKSWSSKGLSLKGKVVFASLKSQSSTLGNAFHGMRIAVRDDNRGNRSVHHPFASTGTVSGLRIGTPQKWWEKGLQPNMREVSSAQDLVDSLNNAGDQLVIVDFFSPGCGGCRALHPKLCQLAEANPDVLFLQVNYEEHKSMCYSLNVHVLPFFRFYRGAHGRLCNFSCTNATIKKFKDFLAKHSPDRCSIGPTKGLEEKELIALAANKDLSFTYTPRPSQLEPAPALVQSDSSSLPLLVPSTSFDVTDGAEDKALVASGR